MTAVTADVRVAPPGAARRRSKPLAWWGMMTIIATESMVFVGLLSSYLFLRASSQQWPPLGIPLPEIPKTAVFSVLLIGSSLPVIWGERGIKQGRQFQLRLGWGSAKP